MSFLPPGIQQAARDFTGGLTNDPSVYQGGAPRVGGEADRPTSLFGQIGQSIGDLGRGLGQEGLGGLLDPAGMMDRQAAARELSSRFTTVPDDFVGPRLPNQVTESEFRNLTRQYSDIRLGRSDIKLDTAGMNPADAKAFRDGAMTDIADMLQTDSGRTLINRLSNNTSGGERDAAGNPVHHTTTLKAAADPNDPGTASDHPDRRFDGTGTNVTIDYKPGHTVTMPGATDSWIPWRSDVALAHEMTHAYYNTAGTAVPGTVTAGNAVHADDVGQNLREYQATGLGTYGSGPGVTGPSENSYRAERRAMGGFTGSRPDDATMPQRTKYTPTIP